MAFYKKSKLHTGTALICSLAIVFSALPVYATDTIDNLQNQTSALENELKGINQDILTLSEKISDTEMQTKRRMILRKRRKTKISSMKI